MPTRPDVLLVKAMAERPEGFAGREDPAILPPAAVMGRTSPQAPPLSGLRSPSLMSGRPRRRRH